MFGFLAVTAFAFGLGVLGDVIPAAAGGWIIGVLVVAGMLWKAFEGNTEDWARRR